MTPVLDLNIASCSKKFASDYSTLFREFIIEKVIQCELTMV